MFWQKLNVDGTHSVSELRNRIDVLEIPDSAIVTASASHILGDLLGYRTSCDQGCCRLGDGTHIPMMSYALVEYLMGLDFSGCQILELGGGYSTLFWSKCARQVTTYETSDEWAQSLQRLQLHNLSLHVIEGSELANEVLRRGGCYDVITIDSDANRYRCAKAGLQLLAPGGIIILDNSEWYPNTSRLLREAELIQVDFSDFRPLRWYRATTSLFLRRDFQVRPKYESLPVVPIGGKHIPQPQNWDEME